MEYKTHLTTSEIQILLGFRGKSKSRSTKGERKQEHDLASHTEDEEWSHQYEAIQGCGNVKQELLEAKTLLALKESEVSGLQVEGEIHQMEIATMKEHLEVKTLEVSQHVMLCYCSL